MGLYSGELIIGRIFASEIWGGLLLEGLIVEILRYLNNTREQKCNFILTVTSHFQQKPELDKPDWKLALPVERPIAPMRTAGTAITIHPNEAAMERP